MLDDAQLLAAAQQALPNGADVVRVERQQAGPRTELLRLHRADGSTARCALLKSIPRELELYRTVLTPAETGAPALLGAVEPWLFLEALPAAHPDLTDPDQVEAVYAHLAALHRRFLRPAAPAPDAAAIADTLRACPATAPLAAEAAELLTAGPTTLVHGDYHRWNLVPTPGGLRLLDWEHAAFTHPVWDLVLLAPEEPGWDAVPRGPLATLALQTYHRAGPLADLPDPVFLRLQRLARLAVAVRWALRHEAKAAAAPPGAPAEVILAHARQERDRIGRLLRLLQQT